MRNYRFVLFDYEGTLTYRENPDEVIERPPDAYGLILHDWFKAIHRDVDADTHRLQELTEKAHEAVGGIPTALDWRANESYYVDWIGWIYNQLGLGLVSEHERAAAWHFLCWQFGKSYAGVACRSVVNTLTILKERGYRLAVLSNNNGYVRDALLHNGILGFFEHVIDSAREGRVKPDPVLFRAAASRVGVDTSEILYVGDSFECDVIGATLFGMGAAWIGGDEKRTLPENAFVIHAFSELLDHLPAMRDAQVTG